MPAQHKPRAATELLRINDAAADLKKSRHFVYDQIRTGRLPAFRLGARWRIRATDLADFIDREQKGGGGL